MPERHNFFRRASVVIAMATAVAVAVSGCGASSGGESAEGPSTIGLTWWGNAVRDENTRALADAFTELDPDITVETTNSDWGGYWDKLATQVAAGNAPDVIQMDDKYIREYGGRGALLELSDAGIDTSMFVPGSVDPGETAEGLMGISAGIIAPAIVINPAFFEAAGVAIPDDSTWTWDDFTALAAELTEKSPEGTFGTALPIINELSINVWLRQHGKEAFSEDGLGFDADDLAGWFEFNLDLQEAGAAPGADKAAEDMGKPIDQTAFALGQVGMNWIWSNQLNAYDAAMGGGLQLLRYPSLDGTAADAQLWYKASMLWSISARSKDPQAAAELINFLVNTPDAAQIQTTERGIPANTDLRESIQDKLTDSDEVHVAYLDAIESELGAPVVLPPVGAGNFPLVLQRYSEDVLFGRTTPDQAATAMIDELEANIAAAG